MIGSLLISLQNLRGNPRGKQRALMLVDKWFGPFVVETMEGLKLRVFPSSSMDASYFDPRSRKALPGASPAGLVSELMPGTTFVDVGANIGYLSLLASRQVGEAGRVFAFEPSLREYGRLIDNLRLNGVRNVVPYSVALSDCPGIATLRLASHHTGLNRLAAESGDKAGGGIQLTGVLRMDDVLHPGRAASAIELVKIDVEGAELKVLRGMKRLLGERRIRRLVVEVTPDFLQRFGDSRDQLFDYLAGLGFRPKYDLRVAQYDELFELH